MLETPTQQTPSRPAQVMIIGRSAFAGSRGFITGRGSNRSFRMITVTVTDQWGTVHQNVPFMRSEIARIGR